MQGCTANPKHTTCRSTPQSSMSAPKRLLDVGRISCPIRLLHTQGRNLHYATLSHCWGRAPILKTTRVNWQEFATNVSFDALPTPVPGCDRHHPATRFTLHMDRLSVHCSRQCAGLGFRVPKNGLHLPEQLRHHVRNDLGRRQHKVPCAATKARQDFLSEHDELCAGQEDNGSPPKACSWRRPGQTGRAAYFPCLGTSRTCAEHPNCALYIVLCMYSSGSLV